MFSILPITCFVLISTVAAESGYNYPQASNQIAAAVPQYAQQQLGGNAQFFPQAAPVFAAQTQQPVFAAQTQQPVFAPSVGSAPSFQFNNQIQTQQQSSGGSFQFNQPQIQTQPERQTIVSKDIYIHSAPEEYEEINNEQSIESSPNRKNYRIVFIRAPSHNIKINTQSNRQAQAANEEKTVIYVLTKKPDIANIQNQLSATQTEQKASKPEVYFIRYKTQEEASRAQQEIQAQYEALGGSTRVSDEGIAPVTSVIGGGSANGAVSGGGFGSASSGGSNFAQSASNLQQQIAQPINHNQQQFASHNQQQYVQAASTNQQQSFQRPGASTSFGVDSPSKKYLPPKKK